MSTRVRAIDGDNDWTFGKGRNNYKLDNSAVAQNIKTRLQSFLGDCFFAINEGIDWFNLLGGKDQRALTLAISTTILNTQDVTGLLELNLTLNRESRLITIQYEVSTVYTTISNQVTVGIPEL